MCSILHTEPLTVQERRLSGHITRLRQQVHFKKIHQSIFSAMRPIFVRMLRTRKKPMVAVAMITSAIQKAMSQLCCLAMVLNGSPAVKAPTVTKKSYVQSYECCQRWNTTVSEANVSSGCVNLQLTISHQSYNSMRGSTKIGRSTFTGYHPKQGNWSVRTKSKHSTEEEDPDLCMTMMKAFLRFRHSKILSPRTSQNLRTYLFFGRTNEDRHRMNDLNPQRSLLSSRK